MRYLVKAQLKEGQAPALKQAIADGTLGHGSVAEGEYLRNMAEAQLNSKEEAEWVEICFCSTPLEEERPYWEEFFHLVEIKDAHARRNCRHENGTEHWACLHCDCTTKLEAHLKKRQRPFLASLESAGSELEPEN